MSFRWEDVDGYPEPASISAQGWLRVILLGPLLLLLNFGSLLFLLLLRLIERPVWGHHRPWTPHIVQFVCRNSLRLMRIRFAQTGEPMKHHGAIVSNHSSWLDIYVLNARKRIYFVSKAEVSGWFGIGPLARATGTVFIERSARHARSHRDLLRTRLSYGHKLLFFPEGTSTSGRVVLPFKPTLFDALFDSGAPEMCVQPVAVHYQAPKGEDLRFYGWWGELEFVPHLVKILGARHGGAVTVHYLKPLRVADFPDRKSLARACHDAVEAALAAAVRAESA